jgi:hypothetical protein
LGLLHGWLTVVDRQAGWLSDEFQARLLVGQTGDDGRNGIADASFPHSCLTNV